MASVTASLRRPGILIRHRNIARFLPGLITLSPFIIVAILAPILPLQDPVAANPIMRHLPPSSEHWFGTDIYGMDVFSRVLHAARLDFMMTVLCVLFAVSIGAPLGAAAGFFGGALETIIQRLAEVIQSFPIMLFAMMVQIALGTSTTNLIVVIGVYIAPFYAKLVRSLVKPLRDVDYIQAARVTGQTSSQILFRHLIPNALPAIVSQFTLSAAVAIRILSGLSFLGLGVAMPTPEWGSMIQLGAGWMVFGKWWPSVFPGLALFLTTWGLTQIGEEIESMYTLQEQ
ncbi:MAG: ABC transporter permease [Anaerolineales bacterium]|nr:ABC transporter permease [Anaerolineales bacterium]